ncbi:uncharacterized protein N7459_003313 [Penicillium hispanicum]|uniref:uncharacterized protein n=1 Tax=Penicillium hispanicum TaxID=1080232 RepID=UPI002540B3EB|nr:uncharacterized protein N7459_003313 [Penicillium hispanicum]KAJ5587548.1 hypothetical protein N7459_003313 [Penicillium hispanicum]
MSSSDHLEPGVPNLPDDPESGATAASPQDSQPPPAATDRPSVPDESDAIAEPPASAISSGHVPSGDAAAANHPATGGESAAPVTATTATTTTTAATTPSNDNTNAVAPTQNTDTLPMDTNELKTGTEAVSDQSEGISGKEVEDPGPSLDITLLLTTGSRHPFTIDAKYLRKRSVNVENYDPFAMSVYTLKELIWREWRSDWETRPSSPSSIRLISFGKLLDDKSPLSDSKFNHDAPNVVHMTVKPQEVVDEEDAKGAKAPYSRDRESNERSPGCRCVIL